MHREAIKIETMRGPGSVVDLNLRGKIVSLAALTSAEETIT